MPNPIPIPPEVKPEVKEDADGTLTVGKSVLYKADRGTLLGYLQDHRQVLVWDVTEDRVLAFGLLRDMIGGYRDGAKGPMLGWLARYVNVMADWCGYPLSGQVDMKGVPKKQGVVEAGQAAAQAVSQYGTETHNAHVDPMVMQQQADYVQGGLALEAIGLSIRTRAARCYVPVLRTLAQGVRTVVSVTAPILPTHPDLAQVLQNAVRFVDVSRGVHNRKKNLKKKAKVIQQTEAAALPKAREQVRAQVTGELQDQLSGFLRAVK